jgi:hypothetical protein
MDLLTLRNLLENAWCVETSYDPALCHKSDRASGQCCVTALVVQDYFGGTIMRGVVNGGSHYWNNIDGLDVDLTWRQFPIGAELTNIRKAASREKLLANVRLRTRYKRILKLIDL